MGSLGKTRRRVAALGLVLADGPVRHLPIERLRSGVSWGLQLVNSRRLEQLVVGAVALHSLILGTVLLLFPARTLHLAGWDYDGPLFFPAQAGIFLIILGIAYTIGIWRRSFVWFLIGTKAVAVIFLVSQYLAGTGPALLLLAAVLDGVMGGGVAAATLNARCSPPASSPNA